jgi:glutathione S-transferase
MAEISVAERYLPVLYSFRRCPYAMRARLALAISQQQCALREILLRDKPAEMITVSPKASVPVLHLPDGQVIDESLDIMRWALAHHDPQQWLTSENGDLLAMEALIAECDGPFKHHLDRYKYASRYGLETDPMHHRSEGGAFLKQLDKRLSQHRQLFDAQARFADFAIFPFVRQFANTDREWFDAQPLENLQPWLAGHLGSALFQGIMKKWAVWQPGDVDSLFPDPT